DIVVGAGQGACAPVAGRTPGTAAVGDPGDGGWQGAVFEELNSGTVRRGPGPPCRAGAAGGEERSRKRVSSPGDGAHGKSFWLRRPRGARRFKTSRQGQPDGETGWRTASVTTKG